MNSNPNNQNIIHAIVFLCQSFNIKTVAEGIETQAELDKLRDLGVNFGQGYFLDTPMPFSELQDKLHKQQDIQ